MVARGVVERNPTRRTSCRLTQMLSSTAMRSVLVVAVTLVWCYVLRWRLPYMDQIPVFDADQVTAMMVLWARSWYDEGLVQTALALPYSPASIETPTFEMRRVYQSWPPGAVVPIYLASLVLQQPPTAVIANWINAIGQGITGIAAALAVFGLARTFLVPVTLSFTLGLAASLPVLLTRGPMYAFSQIYCHTSTIYVWYAIFMAIVVSIRANVDERGRRRLHWTLLAVAGWGLWTDWLAFLFYGVWLAFSAVGIRRGWYPQMSRAQRIVSVLLPCGVVLLFLIWRWQTPGAIAQSEGVIASAQELVFKVLFRMYLTEQSRFEGDYLAMLGTMHDDYYWRGSFLLAVIASAATALLAASLFWWSRDHASKVRSYALMELAALVVVPNALWLAVFSQHSVIHRWSALKSMLPLGIVAFGLLPLVVIALIGRRDRELVGGVRRRTAMAAIAVGALMISAWLSVPSRPPFLLGRVDKPNYEKWMSIDERTSYADVVFSPSLEAEPISVRVGVANKLIYPARNFGDVNRRTASVAGRFDVVIILQGNDAAEPFAQCYRPDAVERVGDLTFLRYLDFSSRTAPCLS
jgi:MFS family permease